MSLPNKDEGQLPDVYLSDVNLLDLAKIHTILIDGHALNILNIKTFITGFDSEEPEQQLKIKDDRLFDFLNQADQHHNLGLIVLQETPLDVNGVLNDNWQVLSQDEYRIILFNKLKFNELFIPQPKNPNSSPISPEFLGGQLLHHQSGKTIALFTMHLPPDNAEDAEEAIRRIAGKYKHCDHTIVTGIFDRCVADTKANQQDMAHHLRLKTSTAERKILNYSQACFIITQEQITQNDGLRLLPRATTSTKIIEKNAQGCDADNLFTQGMFPVMFSENHHLPLSDQSSYIDVRQLQDKMRINFDDNTMQLYVYAKIHTNEKALIIHTQKVIPALEALGLKKIDDYYNLIFDYSPFRSEDPLSFRLQVGGSIQDGGTVKSLSLRNLTTSNYLRDKENILNIIPTDDFGSGALAAKVGIFSNHISSRPIDMVMEELKEQLEMA